MSLAVDTVSWRHRWDIQGEVSRRLHVWVWSLGRRSELGLWFLPCPITPRCGFQPQCPSPALTVAVQPGSGWISQAMQPGSGQISLPLR